MIDEQAAWAAFEARDRTADDRFVVAVTTTRIYCRPSCPARRPRREHVRFFAAGSEAAEAGFRACLRCKPDEVATRVQGVMDEAKKLQAQLKKGAASDLSSAGDALLAAGARAIFPPGTVIAEAAADLLAKLSAELGYDLKAAE